MILRRPRPALIWAQFTANHVDRLEAVGKRLTGRADVLAVELDAPSKGDPSKLLGEAAGIPKIRLFGSGVCEDIPVLIRWWAMFRATWRCEVVYLGAGYTESDPELRDLSLNLVGVSLVVMTTPRWDEENWQRLSDYPAFEGAKITQQSGGQVRVRSEEAIREGQECRSCTK